MSYQDEKLPYLPATPVTNPADQQKQLAQQKVSQEINKQNNNGSWLPSLIGAVPDIINQFNYKKQGYDAQIADSYARSAEANAKSSPTAQSKQMIWLVAIVAVVILVIVLSKKQKA